MPSSKSKSKSVANSSRKAPTSSRKATEGSAKTKRGQSKTRPATRKGVSGNKPSLRKIAPKGVNKGGTSKSSSRKSRKKLMALWADVQRRLVETSDKNSLAPRYHRDEYVTKNLITGGFEKEALYGKSGVRRSTRDLLPTINAGSQKILEKLGLAVYIRLLLKSVVKSQIDEDGNRLVKCTCSAGASDGGDVAKNGNKKGKGCKFHRNPRVDESVMGGALSDMHLSVIPFPGKLAHSEGKDKRNRVESREKRRRSGDAGDRDIGGDHDDAVVATQMDVSD